MGNRRAKFLKENINENKTYDERNRNLNKMAQKRLKNIV